MVDKKIYIEVGAHDGVFQSRSLQFAENKNYNGILVEANPQEYQNCLKNRNNERTYIYNKCLVPFGFEEDDVLFNISNNHSAMNSVISHKIVQYKNQIKVPATPLQSILDELNVASVDHFFLDVEGYENQVLSGINFSKTQFSNIEIELHHKMLEISIEQEIDIHVKFLSQFGYQLINKNNEVQPNIIFSPK
jgi:FkbM family methyltransferase